MSKRTASIRVEDDKLARLDRLAEAMDRPRSWLINRAIERFLEEEERFVAAVHEGIGAAERGELVTHEQVMKDARTLIDKIEKRNARR